MPAHFSPVEKDRRGEFRRKLVGGNNEIVTASEGYTSAEDAARWDRDLLRWVIEAHEATVLAAVVAAVEELGLAQADAVADDVVDRLTRQP